MTDKIIKEDSEKKHDLIFEVHQLVLKMQQIHLQLHEMWKVAVQNNKIVKEKLDKLEKTLMQILPLNNIAKHSFSRQAIICEIILYLFIKHNINWQDVFANTKYRVNKKHKICRIDNKPNDENELIDILLNNEYTNNLCELYSIELLIKYLSHLSIIEGSYHISKDANLQMMLSVNSSEINMKVSMPTMQQASNKLYLEVQSNVIFISIKFQFDKPINYDIKVNAECDINEESFITINKQLSEGQVSLQSKFKEKLIALQNTIDLLNEVEVFYC